jgi:hypothetical protein
MKTTTRRFRNTVQIGNPVLGCSLIQPWNGQDPILKERAFRLSRAETNLGEDVKESYFYLNKTSTHSYTK